MAGGEGMARPSDLGVRTASALVMLAIAGGALWLGGWWWTIFVGLVAAGVLFEWRGLVRGFAASPMRRGLWNAGGIVYIGMAAAVLMVLRSDSGSQAVMLVVGAVIATDVGAYFAGRAIGGPKIAPRISPSKTWAGLAGGMIGSSALLLAAQAQADLAATIGAGVLLAILAQTGDFFESWMKRRAGVKDSGRLLPGHGGLFDRLDGLMAVCFVIGLVPLAGAIAHLLSGGALLPSPA